MAESRPTNMTGSDPLAAASIGQARHFYVVRHQGAAWRVVVEGVGDDLFVYGSREEAEQVARGAAKLHWETRGQPSGVQVEQDGEVSTLVCFGPGCSGAGAA